ncbi:RNAse (barnase) inhibitor barstar [Dysgonomonas sp. PFB1-18]|uniref:barstar family protein n=1 Tax=unclassified Dysgonomonas TaxID=2630389 RepID=UPI00247639AD|nr:MULTISPECIES: hypothetical protein [unclassified Dysgonomonas]MDH6308934.1 RNAse (barnase) inhibitor barstar [Dysgonomonas sp. PF1-14]MDH6338685.1 RNAse (barnase) inhibitor barstar [Dysgonomonas sp. PF1-16]MDH6380287.1 RNAse (barnase) inhibitor barstar [Dysgonomonas sp. PFB1-18]MDH6397617.1 RNAse (barnase) inhibitor barstar [Dysgonomonas sp. PF1-23]
MKTISFDGNNVYDIPSFYDEINRVFMANVDWRLGQSLDALNDMFYGGYGEIDGDEEITLIWKGFEKNREDLGLELTKTYYLNKLQSPSIFNIELIKENLAELENGTGKTYFEIILEIIGEHPNIKLVPQ